jgi:hypothetical protein
VKLVVKCLAVILASTIFCAVIWICWVWHRTDDLALAFARVQHGDSAAQVVEIFRQPPTFIGTELQTNIDWDESWLTATSGVRCVQQFHFCPPFSICGEEWVVGFDERSNAVAKYHIVSP